MNSSRWKSTMRRCLPITCILAAGFPHPAPAQTAALKEMVQPLTSSRPAAFSAADQPDESRTRLEQWLRDARDTRARLEAADAATTLPGGISTGELDDRRRDLEQTILTIARSLKNFNSVADARKDLETSRAEAAAWQGFKDPPPYSLLMVDDLLNERDAVQANLDSFESSLSNYQRHIATTVDDTKAAEDAVSNSIVTLQNADATTHDAAKWRLEAARARSRLLAVRAGFIQTSCESLIDRIAAAKTQLTLLDRQIKTAKANARFNNDDLTKIGKVSAARKQAVRKEIEKVSQRLKAAMIARTQAQAALTTMTSPPPAPVEPPGMELAKYRLEVAEGRVEAMQSLAEGLESLLQLEDIGIMAYQDRKALIEATSPQQRTKTLESLGVPRERLWAWENVLDDALASSSADLGKLEARAASISPEDPRFSLLNEQRASTSEKHAMLQRVSQAVNAQRKLVKRWVLEYSPNPNEVGLMRRISSLSAASWGAVKKFWSFEVSTREAKVEVDGQTITGKVPITLGDLLRALLFFIIGYWISSIIARRIETGLVSRGHIVEAQAKTLRNWAMILVGVLLAIATLSFLNIPLTLFAFLGGALAIGLGFGMQTLIKNFISGIIVLAERKVRIGDMLNVDGIIGTVTEINTRSSIIRSPDDVETMIPNSLFLENRVTNWTLTHRKIRLFLRVGVAYGTPPQKMIEILTEAAGRHGLVCKEPAPFVVFDDFGENALVFHLYFWLDLKGSINAMIVTSDLRLMIEKRFAETGIEVPFPKRTVHLNADSPIKVEWTNATMTNDQ
jgi:small-conductance mechanosensitive channel